ncbi:PAS domain S-box-containing protein [Bradyrhizobium sp. F1.4.3]|uniref:PAS domain-containing sensor histidine kinase n=1 Tax=Bradyrhizobium sp. F1.4.3 TaxID=3156356 RepID=UPI003392F985
MSSSVVREVQFPKQPALQLIYDTAPIGLAYLSPDCRYLQINQRLTEICGISVEGHLGRTVQDCVPGLASAVEGIVRSIMETGDPVTGVEVYGQRPGYNDERCWITHWHPQRGPNGNIVGVNVAAEEITERKRSERELRSARDAAEAALQRLKEAQDSLVEAEKLAALGRLVAGVAHEINSPVGTSLTVTSALERKRVKFAAEVARGGLKRSSLNEFLAVVQTASSHLADNLARAAELIQSFKQVAVDQDYLERRSFDPGELTRQVAASLQPELGKSALALNVECRPGLAMNSYPGPYVQVMTNLLMNAVVHAFPHGTSGTINVEIRTSGQDDIEIAISDNGCGMSEELRRQAFNPFFTTRRSEGSIGLGLHIVHNIVFNRLGGRISLESAPGEGTRIWMIVPRVAPEASDT